MSWRGRCCGCGFESGRRKPLKAHIVACPDYAKLAVLKPERIRTPEAEYEWWVNGLAQIKSIQAELETLYLTEKSKLRI